MAALFAIGSYNAKSLYSAFGERELIPQLAMMQTLADYIRSNMTELVDTPSKQSKLTWDDINLSRFDKTLFRIHITVVYEGYVHALEKVFDPNDDKGIITTNPAPVFEASPTSNDKTKDRGTLAQKSRGMARSRCSKPSKAPSNPGSSNTTWTTSSSILLLLNTCGVTCS